MPNTREERVVKPTNEYKVHQAGLRTYGCAIAAH